MQRKYIEHYTAAVFHKFFMNTSKEVGESPFRAAVLNYLYAQNPDDPDKVRIQSFIAGILDFYEQVKDMPDPDPAPAIVEVSITEQARKDMEDERVKLAAAVAKKAAEDAAAQAEKDKVRQIALKTALEIFGDGPPLYTLPPQENKA